VTTTLLKRAPGSKASVGDPIELSTAKLSASALFLARSVFDLDARAAKKFRLARKPFGTGRRPLRGKALLGS
jgi:hypothetical protein